MAQSSKPIITFGYDEAEVSATLSSKGYDLSKAKYTGNLNISDITDETDLLLQICSKVDNLLARLAAKNIFNLDKWSYGKEYPEMPFAICDNKKRKIVEGKNPLCVEWPNSKYSINIIENNIVIVPKK